MPDPPAPKPAFNLTQGQERLVAEVARLTGTDPAAVIPSSYGLEEGEIWGSGVAWNAEKLQVPGAADLQLFFIDLYSGQVITYREYEACWADLVAHGGPFEFVTPAPSFSPGPGLLGIAPGKPYLDTPINPVFVGYNFRPPEAPPFDDATLSDIYARVSPLITTINGLPYLDIRSDFYCSQVDCKLQVLGWLPNAADPDEWWFEVGRDGSKGEVDRSDSWPFPFRAVPHDAVEELLSIVAADPQATLRAAQYDWFASAVWYPKHPDTLALTYEKSHGMSSDFLIIKIDIGHRTVTDYATEFQGG